jgi:hypothetical protein
MESGRRAGLIGVRRVREKGAAREEMGAQMAIGRRQPIGGRVTAVGRWIEKYATETNVMAISATAISAMEIGAMEIGETGMAVPAGLGRWVLFTRISALPGRDLARGQDNMQARRSMATVIRSMLGWRGSNTHFNPLCTNCTRCGRSIWNTAR